jgi:MATE family multidrug resistance protein
MAHNISLPAEEAQHISFRRILIIALPLVLESLAMTLMSVVDRLFLVQYDVLQSAATGSASMVAFTFIFPINAIIAFSGNMVAQYYGAKRFAKLAAPVWTALFFAVAMSLVVLAVMPVVGRVFALFKHSEELIMYEKAYMNYMFIAMTAGLLSGGFFSYFSGMGQTVKIMLVAIISNVVNTGLNWVLIFGHGPFPEMGIHGAGVATVVSSLVGGALVVILYVIAGRKNPVLLKPVLEFDVLRRMLRFGFPAGLQTLVDMGSFTVLILAFARLSPEVALATGLVMQIKSFVYMPVMSLAYSGSIIAGQEAWG